MSISDARLASLALTHVYYDPSDIFGLPSAFLALFPQALIVAYIVTIYTRREVETGYMFTGQLVCEVVNWILKRLIKQDRPQHTIGVGKGYGMPSSHSQFMGFFAAYAVLYIKYRIVETDWSLKKARMTLVLATSIAVCVSRVYLTYHTVEQVLVGASLGTAFGALWFITFSQLKSYGFIDWALDLKVSRIFLVKDTVIDQALHDEYLQWRSTRGRVSEKKRR